MCDSIMTGLTTTGTQLNLRHYKSHVSAHDRLRRPTATSSTARAIE